MDELELISRYRRADALADGVLVDVSSTAQEVGIQYPTAVTHAVFEEFVRVPDGLSDQDEWGRLWDILFLLRVAIGQAATSTDSLCFQVAVKQSESAGPVPMSLQALCHPGDDGEPVITIMLPGEGASRHGAVDPFSRKEEFERNQTPGPSSLPDGETPRGR